MVTNHITDIIITTHITMVDGTDITRTMDMVTIPIMVTIIITDTTIIMVITITTTDIIHNHVDSDMLLQMPWVGTGIIINHIIRRILQVM